MVRFKLNIKIQIEYLLTMVNRMFIDREYFYELVNKIKPQVEVLKPDLLVGILNGGKNIVCELGKALKIPVEFIKIHSREGDSGKRGEMTINKMIDISLPVSLLNQNKSILIVDDIYDSGTTMNTAQKLFPNSSFCVLLSKQIIEKPNIYGEYVKPDTWVDFFWEK